ncbi:MAG TPA: ferritin [Methylomirabilota bacterium]|nr:ferritin [Methylomirabilota bacterium]
MNDAINQQIGNEFAASLQYVEMASHFSADGLPVFAKHFFKQAEEERDHAMRFVKFILDAGGVVQIPTLPAPQHKFATAEEAVSLALEQEKSVTRQISALAELAIKESDHITKTFLDWFLKEQLEEVSSMDNLLRMVQRAGEDRLLYVESHLSGSLSKGEPDPAKDED